MFPTASLFRREICDLPTVHIELRNFLDERGTNLQQYSSHRAVMTLAHGLYEETEDKQAAVEIAREIVAAGRHRRPNSSGSNRREETSPASYVTHATSTNLASPEQMHITLQ